MNFVTRRFFPSGAGEGLAVFLIHAFGVAGVAGTLVLVALLLLKKMAFSPRSILAGVLLGVPNYFSMYFFLKLLNSGFMQSSAAIPVNNIATVLCAVLVAIVFFREKAALPRILGLVLSITAIILIALSDLYAGAA
jgi:uncharacterized membrane protein